MKEIYKMNNSLFGFHLGIGILYTIGMSLALLMVFAEPNFHPDTFAIVFLIILIIITILHFIAAFEVKKGHTLGRVLSKILGSILLLGFPLGTFIGWLILSYAADDSWESTK